MAALPSEYGFLNEAVSTKIVQFDACRISLRPISASLDFNRMPTSSLEARYQQTLDEIVTVSQQIRRSVLTHAANEPGGSNQSFNGVEKLRRQLETIRTSSDTILEAITLNSCSVDERIIDWLFSGELRSCLDKLKELSDILKPDPDGQSGTARARPFTKFKDKLNEAAIFFDKHASLFYFLLNPDIWNNEGRYHQPHQLNTFSGSDGQRCDHQDSPSCSIIERHDPETEFFTASEDERGNRALFNANEKPTARDRKFLRQKFDEVSRWLVALDCTHKHDETLRLRQEGTCTWLPETEAFKGWRTSLPRLLWLHGKAGCGKSVLVASAIEHLRMTLRRQEVVLYFYFDFRDERSTNPTEMIRSLLSQLYQHIYDLGVDPGDIPNKILGQKSEGTLSLNDLDKLCSLLLCMASCLLYDPLIVIDALDECVDMDGLLRSVIALSQGDVRLLVTSRPDENIARRFDGFRSLSLETVPEKLAVDIALHITREVDLHSQLRSVEPVLKNEIHTRLSERAKGRFRWVQCQLDTLKRCGTSQGMKKALENLPTGLEATYERILETIDERKLEGKLVRRLLAWLVVALAPLRLVQILEGFSVDLQQRRIDFERQSLRPALLGALSSLVTHDKKTDVIVLSHFSVKEYLMGRTAPPVYQIIPHEAHVEIAETCMRYISAFLKSAFRGRNALFRSFPMLSYIFWSGFNHLAYVDPESTRILEDLSCLELDVRYYPSHWDRLCRLREEDPQWSYPPWPLLRHDFVTSILIAYASIGLLQSFISRHHPFKSRAGTNPLVYAIDLRKTEQAVALLACGCDVNMPSLVIDGSHDASPLEAAINLGDDVLVGELLQRGCTVTSEILSTAVCMPWCGSQVLAKLMQTDEWVEWANDIGDENLFRGIFSSARPIAGDTRRVDEVHVALARRLRQVGQDLSADLLFGQELIERAVHAAHISLLEYLLPPDQPPPSQFLLAAATGDTSETVSVIRFFLQRGADVNAVSDGSWDTALHLAAMCPWEPRSFELTKMLINAGCDPHAYNLEGETPWIIAAKHEYSSVVELLISTDISLPPDILLVALRKCLSPQLIQSLLLKGADMHPTSPSGDTILQLAISGYTETACFRLVRSFIAAGYNPTVSDNTTIGATIECGYTLVTELLISCGVPFPLDILILALWNQTTPEIVRSLVYKGADVHVTTPDAGDTLLHLAIATYAGTTCRDLVKDLVDAGCNPTSQNAEGQTVLQAAIVCRHTLVVVFLLSHNVPLPPNILLFALQEHSTRRVIQFLIHKGADVHATTSEGDTVLHVVISNYAKTACRSLVASLIENGCDPNACNFSGQTILKAAILHGRTSVVKFLLSRNVPFTSDILLFALRERSSPQIVQILIGKCTDVHSTTSEGETVLHLAIAGYTEPTCLDFVKYFIEAGCNPIVCKLKDETVLEAAVARGHHSVVEHLLSCNVSFSSDILLFALRRHSTPRIIRSLIHQGADVHSKTSDEDTVLHISIAEYAEGACWDLVTSFVEAGCNPTARNVKGQTVLEAAITRGYTSVMQYLLLSCKVSLPPDILLFALRAHSMPQVIESLIGENADVHVATPDGDTVLHVAVTEYDDGQCWQMVKCFAEAGCDLTGRNRNGQTVLEAAIAHVHVSVVECLLLRNVPFPSDILLFALVYRFTPQMIRSLVGKGASVHPITDEGNTVLHLAIWGYAETTCLGFVKAFIEAGCNPTARNVQGQTALDVAVTRKFTLVVKFLFSCNGPLTSPQPFTYADDDLSLIQVRPETRQRR